MDVGRRLIIADDSSFARAVLEKHLEGTEFRVVGQAGDSKEASDLYRNAPADAVVLDVIMPGQDGVTTVREIIALDPGARILIVSSLGTQNVVEECLREGARAFLQKPCERERLIEALRALFR